MGKRMDMYETHKQWGWYSAWDKFKFKFGDFCDNRARAWYEYGDSIKHDSSFGIVKGIIASTLVSMYEKLGSLCD